MLLLLLLSFLELMEQNQLFRCNKCSLLLLTLLLCFLELLERVPFLRLHDFFLELLDQFLLLLVGETSFYLELLQHHLILCLDALSLLQLFLLLVID